MEKIEGTNTIKQKIIEEAEEKNEEPSPEKLKNLETDSIIK